MIADLEDLVDGLTSAYLTEIAAADVKKEDMGVVSACGQDGGEHEVLQAHRVSHLHKEHHATHPLCQGLAVSQNDVFTTANVPTLLPRPRR